jgi:hypothetical protein
MRPLGFLTGVVLGSAAAISLVLLMVVLTLALSASREPEIGHEYPALLVAAALFGGLAALAGTAFVGLQRERPWRWAAQAAMWLLLAGIAWFYWPAGGTPGG